MKCHSLKSDIVRLHSFQSGNLLYESEISPVWSEIVYTPRQSELFTLLHWENRPMFTQAHRRCFANTCRPIHIPNILTKERDNNKLLFWVVTKHYPMMIVPQEYYSVFKERSLTARCGELCRTSLVVHEGIGDRLFRAWQHATVTRHRKITCAIVWCVSKASNKNQHHAQLQLVRDKLFGRG